MAEAKQPGGLYYIGDKAVDANGKEIEDAPRKPKDTPRDKQPGALGGPAAGPATELANAIVGALRSVPATAKEQGTGSAGQSEELPTIKDLPDHVGGLKTAAEVKAMQKKDDRVSAEPIYKARLAELKEEK